MGKALSVWVLTREINDYNQEGAYFEAVFAQKPTAAELVAYFTKRGGYPQSFTSAMAALDFILHLLEGGGRQATEEVWYNLTEEYFITKATGQ